MNPSPDTLSKNLVALAQMLERLERSAEPVDADQFRGIVERLKAELGAAAHDATLEAVLATFPCTAELYENMQYAHAGLCRSPLDAAARGELEATRAIEAIRARKQQA